MVYTSPFQLFLRPEAKDVHGSGYTALALLVSAHIPIAYQVVKHSTRYPASVFVAITSQ